jgi:predicted MFS family arabinose efflux permease
MTHFVPPDPSGAAHESDASPASWFTLAALTLTTFYIFLDRQVFVLLAEPIRKQLVLTDFELGLLQGVGLAVFAAAASYPIGWLADRRDRRWVLAGCTAIWCVAVIGCGLAQTFPQLFMAGALVGIGEAAITPIVYSWIPELFRGSKRIAANSIFAIAGRLGIGLAIALVGYLITQIDVMRSVLPAGFRDIDTWRLTFFALALPGPLFILLVLSLKRQHKSPKVMPSGRVAGPDTGATIAEHLRAHRMTLISFYLGTGFAVFAFGAAGVWLPVAAMRQFGTTPAEVGGLLGSVSVIASLLGLVFTIYGTRIVRPWFGDRMPVLVIAIACAAGALSLGLLLVANDARSLFMIYGVHLAFVVSGTMLYPTALQELAPTHLRARMVALMSVVLLAFGATAPPLVGLLSDAMKAVPNGLLLATVALSATGLLSTTLLMIICSRSYAATVKAAEVL